jgi:NAD(P)-dependent dehydrogenase (short-subunit alcohol dehydrogenase family)
MAHPSSFKGAFRPFADSPIAPHVSVIVPLSLSFSILIPNNSLNVPSQDATTKGAIVQLARNCAYDLAKYNIRCNSICAGTIETPISKQEREDHGWSYEEWEALKTQDVMLGRVGTPWEIANAAVFFASDESSYCTGTHLMVDGGAAACTVMQK